MPDIILEEDHPRIISAKLVEIGSVVSEEKIFSNFIPPFFSKMGNQIYFKIAG
jgi:hypothetical protein